jgi:hypothetical protein
LAGVVLLGTGQRGSGQGLGFARLRVDEEEFLLHSDGAHVSTLLL